MVAATQPDQRGLKLVNPNRRAFTVTELVVSVSVLLTVMTVSTTMFFQIQRIWQDIRQQRIAINELSNQLDRLTRLTPNELDSEITNLQPSSICAQSLRQPELSASTTSDDVGTRITLEIRWQRRHGSKPIKLCGWLNPPRQLASDTGEKP